MDGFINPFIAIFAAVGLLLVTWWSTFSTRMFGPHTQQIAVVKTIPHADVQAGGIIPGFPHFPLYPGATITSTQITQPNGTEQYYHPTYQAYLSVKDSVATVMRWYATQLKTNKWVVSRAPDPQSTDDQNIVVSKEDMCATVNAEREQRETTVTIYIGCPDI